MITLLRAFAAWIFTGFYWAVFLFFHLVTFKMLPEDLVSALIRFWGKGVLFLLSIPVEFMNENPIQGRKPRVVICNHQSALDLTWGALLCPPCLLTIGKKEIIYIPFINLVWWALDFIRIDRKNSQQARKALSGVVQKLVRESRSLIISPEGTRTPDGSILPFKKGAFHIAIESQAPIYPIVVHGAYEILPKSAFLPKPGRIRLQFLPPIETRGLTLSDLDSLVVRVREDMIQVYERLRKRS